MEPRLSIEAAKAWTEQHLSGQRYFITPEYKWKMLSGCPHRIHNCDVVHFVKDDRGQIAARAGYIN